ncbi:hypothetical protein VNO78_23377 [Psophocarpus tetragonolobus]|uniref:Uncharacterized protein n=1 Tax=Psophocarpus tetragonolobus TaxID=3891 RepID=A0AAN9XDF7_PSOTE
MDGHVVEEQVGQDGVEGLDRVGRGGDEVPVREGPRGGEGLDRVGRGGGEVPVREGPRGGEGLDRLVGEDCACCSLACELSHGELTFPQSKANESPPEKCHLTPKQDHQIPIASNVAL